MIWPVAVALTVAGPSAALTVTAGKLAAPAFRDREAAARELLAAGPRSFGPLTAATKSPDAEVRRRAIALLAKLEAARLGTPTLVSLHADRRPTAAVVADLARRSGVPLSFNSTVIPVSHLTLHRERVPFWAALDAVCDAAQLATNFTDDGGIDLFPSDSTDPFVSYAGPFRVAATGVQSGQHRQLAGVPRRGLPPAGPEPLHLAFTLAAEPKAPAVGVGPPAVHAADDDHGRSLKPPAEDARTSYSPPTVGQRATVQGFTVTLQRPDRQSTAIRTLRGVVPVAVLAETRPDAVLADPLAAKNRTARGRTADITVTGSSEADGLLTLSVTVTRPAGPADGWQDGVAQRLELTDAAGGVWPFAGVANQSGTPEAVTLAVQYRLPAAGAKPARLALVEWRTVTREVGFEFRDVPLP